MAGNNTTSGAAVQGDNGFFSTIGNSFANTFAQVLPVWTAKELDLQTVPNRGNQQPTYKNLGQAQAQPASLIQFGGIEVSGLTIAVVGVGLLATYLVLR